MPALEHDHRFDQLGTHVRVLVGRRDDAPHQAAVDALRVQARLRALHAALTRFDPGSELSCLNARAGEAVVVSPLLLRAVLAALEAARLSDGLVDPTLLGDLERAGYVASRTGETPAPLAQAIATAPPRRPAAPRRASEWTRIVVDERRGTVRLPRGVRIDLGGSAKGMAVDLAARMLASAPTFVVDAGGDLRAGGTHAAPRSVAVEHPLHGGDAHRFELTTGAVATSGLRTRVWRRGSGFAHHLIDPATGGPAWTGVVQATALAPTALEAEVLAKTALLRGPEQGRAVLARRGGALVLDDGEVVLVGRLDAGAGAAAAAQTAHGAAA